MVAYSSTATGSTTAGGTTGTSEYSGQVALNLIPDTHRPTIVPNTADAHDFGSDDTPTLEFTGSDANDDDLEYEFEILSAIDTDVDKYVESNANTTSSISNGTINGRGQSFTGNGDYLTKVTFELGKSGSPTGFARAHLYAHSGTFGTSSIPTGSALASSGFLDVSTLTTSQVLTNFIFDGTVQMVNTTKYVITLEYNQGASVLISGDDSSPTHGGNESQLSSGTWSAVASLDLIFYVEGNTRELNKLSVTPDATFTNTTDGGDTHPFDQPDKIDYTVQAGDALADATWYWRCRAKDDLGTNEWSDWTVIRSFDVGSGAVQGTSHINTDSTTVGALSGRGALADADTTSSVTSAVIGGFIQQSSHITTDSTTSATGQLKGNLDSSINTSSVTSSAITGRVAGASAINTSSTTSEALSGRGALASDVTTSSVTSATMGGKVKGISNINTSSVTSSQLDGTGSIGSTINTLSTTSGVLLGRGQLESAINTSSTTSAAIEAGGASGISHINTSSTTSAQLDGIGEIASVINTSSTTSANLTAKGELASAITTDSTTSATGQIKGVLASAINTSSTTSSAIAGRGELASAITTDSTISSALDGVGALASDINTTSTTLAALIQPPQFARPDGDNTIGSWTDDGGGTTDIFQAIDEVTANDSDYIRSENDPSTSAYIGTLSDVDDPVSSDDHIVRYRYQKGETGGGAPATIDLIVELRQGVTVIASQTHNGISTTITAGTFTLTGTEADNITNYADLRFRFEADKSAGARTSWAQDTWFEFQVPISGSATAQGASDITTTSTTSAAIEGIGELASDINTVSTTVAAIVAGGTTVNGISHINTTSTTSASLVGVGELADSATTSSITSANLDGVGELGSDINTTSTVSGALAGIGELASDINTQSTTSSSLEGIGELASDINTQPTTSATITAGGSVLGVSHITTTSTTSANLTGVGELASSVNTDSTTTANIQATGSLQSLITTNSTTVALLIGVGELASDINTSSITSAVLFDGSNKQAELDSQTSTITLVKSKTSLIDVEDLQTSSACLTDSQISNLFDTPTEDIVINEGVLDFSKEKNSLLIEIL